MNLRWLWLLALGFLTLSAFKSRAGTAEAAPMPKIPTDSFTRFDNLFRLYGDQQGIPWKWLKAIAMTESTLGTNPRVAKGLANPNDSSSISTDNKSWGLMQMTVPTAGDMEKGTTWQQLNDPQISVRIGAKFLAWIKKQFPGETGEALTKKVIMSYNQGVAGTKQGRTAAAPYWDKFVKHMAEINARQPG